MPKPLATQQAADPIKDAAAELTRNEIAAIRGTAKVRARVIRALATLDKVAQEKVIDEVATLLGLGDE